MGKDSKKDWSESTVAVRAGLESDKNFDAVMPPLYTSTNYVFTEYGKVPEFDYARGGNPTREILGKALADMEGGFGGVMTSSGMAALDLVFNLLDPGDVILAPHDCYGGTYRLLRAKSQKGHYDVRFIDQTDKEVVQKAFKLKPKMVLIETPSNPLLRITDIAFITDLAKSCNALVVADNTFLTPVLQKPFIFGVDIIVHSTTKYINGHSDVIGGAVIAKNEEIYNELKWWCNCVGYAPSPFDCYLTLRGVRTLNARMTRQQNTAVKLTEFLQNHDAIEKLYYPGLSEHPGYDIAKKQQTGFGAMISFDLKGGEAAVREFVDGMEIFSLAESLGGVESLICHPATMTHRAMGPQALEEAGVSMGLLRISTGQEDADDLIAALNKALASIS